MIDANANALSEDQSPDWYEAEAVGEGSPGPPFDIELVQAGPRLGWAGHGAFTNISAMVHLSTRARAKSNG
eukprot:scaffold591_cov69-Skeletonema_dohrnii-CCMP3373.AAC.3